MTTRTRKPAAGPDRYLLPIGTWAALAIYCAIVIPYFGYLPLWDSMENLEEYLFLPRQHLYFENLVLMHNGHPSLGYFWPFWLAQTLFPSQILAIHIINLLIGSLAIVSFGKIVAFAFEGLANAWEKALITIAFAVHPVFIAFAINDTPDYGVLAYFLATLWMLYSGRLGWAALTGVLLIFSKEIGVPLYLLLAILYLSGALRSCRWRQSWPLAIPLGVFFLFCIYQWVNDRSVFPWMDRFVGKESTLSLYFPNPFKSDFGMACLGPFVLEFQWIFTAIILVGVIYGLVANRPVGGNASNAMFWLRTLNLPFRCFLFLLAGVLYVESRTVIFTNQRYFLVLYALVPLLFLAALVQLKLPHRARLAVLAGGIVLLFACNFRTLDPLSKKITGTFDFGRHQMLAIGTMRPDFGDLNRDEMVYNLEHTHLSYLMDQIFAAIRPTNDTVIAMPGDCWWLMSRLDAKTYHLTESTRLPYIKPIIDGPEGFPNNRNRPQEIFVLMMPYFHQDKEMALLDPYYQVKAKHVFDDDGYQIEVLDMTRKPAPSTPKS